MDDWLDDTRAGIGRSADLAPSELELTPNEERVLLDAARVAAHASGARTNAPLLCYLLGLARGRSGVDLEALTATVLRDATSGRRAR
jgi:Domain of unknown function (DUF6457)